MRAEEFFLISDENHIVVVYKCLNTSVSIIDVLADTISDRLKDVRSHIPAESHVLPFVYLAIIIEGEPFSKLFRELNMHISISKVKLAVKLIAFDRHDVMDRG